MFIDFVLRVPPSSTMRSASTVPSAPRPLTRGQTPSLRRTTFAFGIDPLILMTPEMVPLNEPSCTNVMVPPPPVTAPVPFSDLTLRSPETVNAWPLTSTEPYRGALTSTPARVIGAPIFTSALHRKRPVLAVTLPVIVNGLPFRVTKPSNVIGPNAVPAGRSLMTVPDASKISESSEAGTPAGDQLCGSETY